MLRGCTPDAHSACSGGEIDGATPTAFDDPARPPESTAMSSPAFGQLRLDPEAVEGVAVGLRIVAAVALHEARLSQRPARAAAQRRNAVHERQ